MDLAVLDLRTLGVRTCPRHFSRAPTQRLSAHIRVLLVAEPRKIIMLMLHIIPRKEDVLLR